MTVAELGQLSPLSLKSPPCFFQPANGYSSCFARPNRHTNTQTDTQTAISATALATFFPRRLTSNISPSQHQLFREVRNSQRVAWRHELYNVLVICPALPCPSLLSQVSHLVAHSCPSFSRPRVVDLPVASVLRITFSCPLMSQLLPSPIAHFFSLFFTFPSSISTFFFISLVYPIIFVPISAVNQRNLLLAKGPVQNQSVHC